jgi:hypothetical protein
LVKIYLFFAEMDELRRILNVATAIISRNDPTIFVPGGIIFVRDRRIFVPGGIIFVRDGRIFKDKEPISKDPRAVNGQWAEKSSAPGGIEEVPLFDPRECDQRQIRLVKEGDLGGGDVLNLLIRAIKVRRSLDLTPNPSPSPPKNAKA